MKPQIYIVTGTNGVGKSTFGENFSKQQNIEFINIDNIHKNSIDNKLLQKIYAGEKLEGDEKEAYNEQRIKADKKVLDKFNYLVENEKSFVYESLLTNANLILNTLDKVQSKNYTTNLIYIGADNPNITTNRVEQRYFNGKHNVSIEDQISNKEKGYANMQEFKFIFDNFFLYDNSSDNQKEILLLATKDQKVIYKKDDIPKWAKETVKDIQKEYSQFHQKSVEFIKMRKDKRAKNELDKSIDHKNSRDR